MFDPENPKSLTTLCTAVDASAEKLRAHREKRAEHLRQLVGKWYGDDGAEDSVPINLIELGVNIFQRGVASQDPRACVTSDHDELLPEAASMELAINQQAERINVKDSFNTCSVDALFKLGCMKVGLTSKDTPPDGESYLHDPGNVFTDPVLFEDLLLDMTAKRREQMAFMGDEYTAPLDWVRENEEYHKQAREAVVADDQSVRESESLTSPNRSGEESFEPMVTLRQLYLTRQNLLVTVPKHNPTQPLLIQQWKGPAGGPYCFLAFGKVPGNPIPNAPVPMWADLHDICNRSFNKAWRQGMRQKTFTAVPPAGQADGYSIVEVADGEVRAFNEPDKIKEVSTGGANPANLAMSQLAKSLLVYMGGNWDALGGLAAMSRTVGQDEMMSSGASGRLKDMQQTMIDFQVEVYRHMAYWLWTDPISEYSLRKPVGDTGFSIPTKWLPENRVGSFFEKNFKITTYNDGNRSPMEQAMALKQILLEIIVPLAPAMQQQGIGINWEYLMKTLGKLSSMPELPRSLLFLSGEQIPKADSQGGGMPANTTRTYERVNRPGATRAGADQTLINTLMGGNNQSAELKSLFASTS